MHDGQSLIQTTTETQPGLDHIVEENSVEPDYKFLRLWTETYYDAMQYRIAADNRFNHAPIFKDALKPDDFILLAEDIKKMEDGIALRMRRAYRKVAPPALVEWANDTPGIGEHIMARFIGHLGHPIHATPMHWEGTGKDRQLWEGEPFDRTIGELWSYCGVGDATRKRTKGMTAEEALACGSPMLKSLVYLMAESCVKNSGAEFTYSKGRHAGETVSRARSPFRDVYDVARETYAKRVHAIECKRCGPSGKPAQVGSVWSAAHQHAAALRKTGKEILRTMWIVCDTAEQ